MRMSPKDFWSLTPGEWRWLMAAAAPAAGAMTRGDLARLAAQYPDEAPLAPSVRYADASPAGGGGIAPGARRTDSSPVYGGSGPKGRRGSSELPLDEETGDTP
jgi:hypothetical protein